jgi:hypothetical protein
MERGYYQSKGRSGPSNTSIGSIPCDDSTQTEPTIRTRDFAYMAWNYPPIDHETIHSGRGKTMQAGAVLRY